MLYMGFEVRDQVVQYHPDLNRWDGFMVTVEDRGRRGPDNQLLGQTPVLPGRRGRHRACRRTTCSAW